MTEAKNLGAPYELLLEIKKLGRLPVVNFAAGGIATPADAAYLMSLGCDGIFVGSGIFKAEDAQERARAVVHSARGAAADDVAARAAEEAGAALSSVEGRR